MNKQAFDKRRKILIKLLNKRRAWTGKGLWSKETCQGISLQKVISLVF